MIASVEGLGASPVVGTAAGAAIGALTSFALGRAWVFPRHSGHWTAQAIRYALVAAASVLLNALGEHFASDVAHIRYVLARALVTVVVGLGWNFPMQRRFVFRDGRDGDRAAIGVVERAAPGGTA